MLHRFNFSKLVFLCQRLILRIQMPVILTFFNTRHLNSGCARCAPNQTDSDVPLSRSCDQGKSQKWIER